MKWLIFISKYSLLWPILFKELPRSPIAAILLVGVLATGVLIYRQTSAIIALQEAQVAANAGDIAKAEILANHSRSASLRRLLRRHPGADHVAPDASSGRKQSSPRRRSCAETSLHFKTDRCTCRNLPSRRRTLRDDDAALRRLQWRRSRNERSRGWRTRSGVRGRSGNAYFS